MRKGALALALALVLIAPIASGSELPAGANENLVAVSVDGKLMTDSILVYQVGSEIYFTQEEWASFGIKALEGYSSASDVGVSTTFDEATQTIAIVIPAHMLEGRRIGRQDNIPTRFDKAPKGVMLNYDIAGRIDSDNNKAVSVGYDATTNVLGGGLRTTGQVNYDNGNVEVIRGITTWQKDFPTKGITVQIGDVFTSRNDINSSVNLGGIRIASDDELKGGRRQAIPVIGGLADTRSVAEIYVNQIKREQHQLDRGPFEFLELPLQDGANQVDMIVHDEFGRTTTFSRQIYVTRHNLPKGELSWSITAGAIRKSGNQGNDYGNTAVDASVEYGVNDRWTVGATVQATRDSQNVTLTNNVNLGRAGAVTVDVSQSQSPEGKGQAFAVGYEKRMKDWTVSAYHRQQSEDYWDLTDEVTQAGRIDISKATGVSVGYRPKDKNWMGTLTASDVTYNGGDRTKRVELGTRWSRSPNSSWSFGVGHDFATRDTNVGLTFRWSPKPRTNISTSARAGKRNGVSTSITTVQEIGGREYELGATVNSYDDSGESAHLTARTKFASADVSVDAYLSKEQQSVGARVNGSMWVGEGGVKFQPTVTGSYVVAEVPGMAGVEVSNGSSRGVTNKNGIAVLTSAAPLRTTDVTIDPTNLPMDVNIPEVRKPVSTPRVGGAKVVFDVSTESMREFTATLNGETIVGPANVTTANEVAPVGRRGSFTLMSPEPQMRLDITGEGFSCVAFLPEVLPELMEIHVLTCQGGQQ